ncbi:MAG TPA: F0F1 ATP synthase subunit delta [Candidatus Acidoferrum sp.]|nr:F0F1 ATP synthase subunit delta [Candidatus Acidoferrum sp.]
MKISKQSRREAKDLFRATQVSGVMDENKVRQVVDEMIRVKPRGFQATLSHFQRLVKLDLERRSARVESVIALDEVQQSNVKSVLTRRYGGGLNFSFEQNPTLIGGMRIKVGSDVFDGSIQARLAQLQEV